MSQSGSGQSVSEDSTESQQSGSMPSKPKPDFGKKHRKIVRILTVVAYIISVSTAAVLLSAYYVFLWNPSTPEKTAEQSTTMAMARFYTQIPSHHGQQMSSYKFSSFGLPASQYVDVNNQFSNQYHQSQHNKLGPNLKSRKSSSAPYYYPQQQLIHQIPPTPQSLIMQSILGSTTSPLTPSYPSPSLPSLPSLSPTLPSPRSTGFLNTVKTTTTTFPLPSPSSLSSLLLLSSSLSSPSPSLPSSTLVQPSLVINIPKTDSDGEVTPVVTPSPLPTNPSSTNIHTKTGNHPSLDHPQASTLAISIPPSISYSQSLSKSQSESAVENNVNTRTKTGTNEDRHEDQFLSGPKFPQRDAKLEDIGNPLIIMT